MHAALFGVKRLHLSVVEWSKLRLERWRKVGITPARYDLLRVVQLHWRNGGLPQWKIVRLLGVSATVVSRMLRALEQKGIVRRAPLECDRRALWVALTVEGARIVTDANDCVIKTGMAELCVDAAFAKNRYRPKRDMERAETLLTRARIYFKDRAAARHPWRVVDLADNWGRPMTLQPYSRADIPAPGPMEIDSAADITDLDDDDPDDVRPATWAFAFRDRRSA
jgi:DNA-binding MarR family transcriptional regulator